MAAIHTTSIDATAAIYDLAAYPEYAAPLREEIQKVLNEDGHDIDDNGFLRLKKSSMPKLWKLDSFPKESQRLTPPALSKCKETPNIAEEIVLTAILTQLRASAR
jgi:cytochrome P450